MMEVHLCMFSPIFTPHSKIQVFAYISFLNDVYFLNQFFLCFICILQSLYFKTVADTSTLIIGGESIIEKGGIFSIKDI